MHLKKTSPMNFHCYWFIKLQILMPSKLLCVLLCLTPQWQPSLSPCLLPVDLLVAHGTHHVTLHLRTFRDVLPSA